MSQLKNTKIYRGGKTANSLNLESQQCSFHANPKRQSLDLRFELKSKGGGITEVLIQIGKDDFPALLEAIARKMPENVGVLSNCAAIANQRVLDLLLEARRVQADEQARAQSLLEKLADVEEFITDKYNDAPVGEDERESAVMDQLAEVVEILRSHAEE